VNGWQIAAVVWAFIIAPGAVLIGRFIKAGRGPELDPQWQRFQDGMNRFGNAARRL
jgi:hypothetical protein